MNTICAISTPYGSGGIAVVRVSGEDAICLADTIFRGRKSLSSVAPYTVHFGQIVRGEEVLDEVLVSVFHAPHSYTGENSVEIACHGSLYIQQTLLEWLLDAGCRMAAPGEFTQRAFLNGKMDLTQAEAVSDLIAAQSKAEKDLAMQHIKGGVSKMLDELREKLLHLTSLIELELDFADHEDLEFADREEIEHLARDIASAIESAMQSFRTGNAIRHGIPVAIIGAPNVGKSTLLNALLGEERAIVSDIRGTTRDTIEDQLIIGGRRFRLMDTAGLRETQDTIEAMGIARSREAAQKAAIILLVQDATEPMETESLLPTLNGQTVVEVYNKADLLTSIPPTDSDILYLSAKQGDMQALLDRLQCEADTLCTTSSDVIISNARHYEALLRAHKAIIAVQEGLRMQLSGELLAMDMNDCLDALGEITGKITSEEVLHTIFSRFCIGK